MIEIKPKIILGYTVLNWIKEKQRRIEYPVIKTDKFKELFHADGSKNFIFEPDKTVNNKIDEKYSKYRIFRYTFHITEKTLKTIKNIPNIRVKEYYAPDGTTKVLDYYFN